VHADAGVHAGAVRTEPTPSSAIEAFLGQIAHHMEGSGFQAGGPISTAALEAATTSDRVREACGAAYDQWVAAFRAGLESSGIASATAARLATLIVSAIEGAVVLARVRRSTEPLQHVAEEIGALLHARSTTE
jgi:TetR/AcrR family transcriptional repressor of lmrAB and yxaGH operons